ncbi:unnamed protein product [Ilex paraguariensis]|uniref:DNA repair protein REV1 n=1 Tax=Ilex paraguariensis TaxID=185542 RepID=A0ABC8V167_9AQUA
MSFDSNRSVKSKGSFNSNPSNSSNNTATNNRKTKKTNQKTLGVAWGANSRSSSRSSFRDSPFSDFGSYMTVKNRKLHEQFDADASTSSHSGSSVVKPIFHGVSIFVDGFTIPSSQELRGYMLKYGGRFENYFSRHSVTHIICSHLPGSKIKNLRAFSGGLPVVKPTWVLACVEANKLLSSFFALRSNPVSDVAATCATSRLNSETEDPLLKGGTMKDAKLSMEGESTEHTRQHFSGPNDLLHENSGEELFGEPTCRNGSDCEVNMNEPGDVAKVDQSSVEIQPQCSPCRTSASVSSYCLDNQHTKELSSSTIVQRHSTLEDPNFVENYFKYSRLHFIGTWRNRYRKRFPHFSKEFKCTSPNIGASSVSQKTAIIHVDMDCFFVSVVIRNFPELRDKPVAVCHSDNPRGTAEISSANYPARDHGVRAGIFVRDAKALCPHLVIFPYDFDAYEEVADQFYNILHKHCNKVQAVSCDEAFLDVAMADVEDPVILASIIRKEIFEITKCTASAGIAGNMLMARLATRSAKPDGQCYIPLEKVDDYLNELPIKALPGIGHVLEEKLKRRQVKTCGQLQMIPKESLRKDFGIKTGDMLWSYSRGIDNRLVGVIQESKSIGADVNWGVRFNDLKDSQHFLMNLCNEVALRLQGSGVQGRTFTLKIKKRRNDAGEPRKYMGCGDCENLSHSTTVPVATDEVEVLQRITIQLFGSFHIDVKDIRGMGLQVSKLESTDTTKQAHERNTIRSWLVSASASTREPCKIDDPAKESANRDFEKQSIDGNFVQLCNDSSGPSVNLSNGKARVNHDSTLPPLCDLDMGVIENLPLELFSEINDMYGGKLFSFISKNKGESVDVGNLSTTVVEGNVGVMSKGKGPLLSHLAPSIKIFTDNEGKCNTGKEIQEVPLSGLGTSNVGTSTSVPAEIDLMPSSLSQVDISVLQQLPEELKVDILEHLPAHRRQECMPDASLGPFMSNPQESSGVNCTEKRTGTSNYVSSSELWVGKPPRWVEKFQVSNCWILNIFAEIYYRSGSTGYLSSLLQQIMSETRLSQCTSLDGWDDAISCFCELFKQYIKLKIEEDIEEIYVCFRVLRRLTSKSKFFLQIYNFILPDLQASVGETYGGNFHMSYIEG